MTEGSFGRALFDHAVAWLRARKILLPEVTRLSRAGFDRDQPPVGHGAAKERWESHAALVELLGALPGSAEADARSLLDEVNAMARRNHGPRTEGVTLASLHQAKGLEWDIVFVVGMADGAMPSVYAKSEEELAEEERLLHVWADARP